MNCYCYLSIAVVLTRNFVKSSSRLSSVICFHYGLWSEGFQRVHSYSCNCKHFYLHDEIVEEWCDEWPTIYKDSDNIYLRFDSEKIVATKWILNTKPFKLNHPIYIYQNSHILVPQMKIVEKPLARQFNETVQVQLWRPYYWLGFLLFHYSYCHCSSFRFDFPIRWSKCVGVIIYIKRLLVITRLLAHHEKWWCMRLFEECIDFTVNGPTCMLYLYQRYLSHMCYVESIWGYRVGC